LSLLILLHNGYIYKVKVKWSLHILIVLVLNNNITFKLKKVSLLMDDKFLRKKCHPEKS